MTHISLSQVDHRPWPLPAGPWAMAQRWSKLLFAHWPVAVDELREQIPAALDIDVFDGTGWIGVVPFELRIRPRGLPVVPRVAAFPEINVRTYVSCGCKPGVWFFSLDATSPIAVRLARWTFYLPYFLADIAADSTGSSMHFKSHRLTPGTAAHFEARYRPNSEVFLAVPGTLEHWLTERYCLYASNAAGAIYRTDVQHAPWPLQTAEWDLQVNSMADPVGIALNGPPILHFANTIEVVNWLPQKVCEGPTGE